MSSDSSQVRRSVVTLGGAISFKKCHTKATRPGVTSQGQGSQGQGSHLVLSHLLQRFNQAADSGVVQTHFLADLCQRIAVLKVGCCHRTVSGRL